MRSHTIMSVCVLVCLSVCVHVSVCLPHTYPLVPAELVFLGVKSKAIQEHVYVGGGVPVCLCACVCLFASHISACPSRAGLSGGEK